MIDAELRAQMIAFTAEDSPSPDLLDRIQRGVRRAHSRRLAVVGGVIVAAAATAVTVVAGGVGGPSSLVQGPAAPGSHGPMLGPGDAELRAADWFSYESQPDQPDVDRALERRWQHRDGRHVLGYGDDPAEVISTDAAFPFGRDGVSFDELLALPADAVELDRRMRGADGGRPDDERVLDQVKQLLGRSPALAPVRRALVDAALRHEGVTLVGGAEDSQGRSALLLEHTDRDGAVLRLWIDPAGYRLLEERLVAGPDFPTPPTDGPAPSGGPDYADGELIYGEVFLSWSTSGPPG